MRDDGASSLTSIVASAGGKGVHGECGVLTPASRGSRATCVWTALVGR
jgi:hypothetical protein